MAQKPWAHLKDSTTIISKLSSIMNQIKQLTGTITNIRDLSPTARQYTIVPSEPLAFTAGAFVNVFFDHEGKTIRRAFSISSSDQEPNLFTLSIRLNPDGELTPLLWLKDYTGQTIKLMGPLGLNTADKMTRSKIFLFGFGIGAGVVKSLSNHLASRSHIDSLTIVTCNRTDDEIIHKDYFNTLMDVHPKVGVKYVVSDKKQQTYPTGYIQDYIGEYNFDNADVYMCGQGIACRALSETINQTNPINCRQFVEDFH